VKQLSGRARSTCCVATCLLDNMQGTSCQMPMYLGAVGIPRGYIGVHGANSTAVLEAVLQPVAA
jgi:hypothetical protein